MPKKRGNNEGAIFQRKSGRHKNMWQVSATVGYDDKGKRVRKYAYGRTKEEAQQKLSKLVGEALSGVVTNAKRHTVATHLQDWLDTCVKGSKKENTYISYEVIVRRHINPRIGGIKIEKVTSATVQAMQAEMVRSGTSPRLRQFAHSVLNQAMENAVRLHLISSNPCSSIDPPKVPSKSNISALSQDQAISFLSEAKNDLNYALYVLAIMTGMRQGEILALHWDDVNLNTGDLFIRHTLLDLKGKLQLGTPKTKKGARRIKLPELAQQALIAHRQEQEARGLGKSWVFCDTEGGWIRKGNFQRRSFKPLLKRAGLPESIRFHDLRHTAASLLLLGGINPKVVQEILGHSKVSVTLDIYSHMIPTLQDEAAARMDRLLGEPPKVGCNLDVQGETEG